MQVPRHQAWEGVIACAGNARDLIGAAGTLSRERLYGQAAALAVLSAEESSKALGLLARVLEPPESNASLRPFFRNHSFKHQSARFVLSLSAIMQEMANEVVAIQNDPSVPKNEYGRELARRCTDRLQFYIDSGAEPVDGLEQWQKTADQQKQRGLYVNFSCGIWESPQDVSREEYDEMDQKARQLLNFVEGVVENGDIAAMREILHKATGTATRFQRT